MHASKIAITATLVLAAACSSSSTPSTSTPAGSSSSSSGGSGDGGGSAATFTQVYSDIISKDCVSCHNPAGEGNTIGKLDMSTQSTAFTNLVGVAGAGAECSGMGTRVVAGDADMSLLYQKVTNPTCGEKMPLGGTALTEDQADEIEGWINAGAMND
jgi:hypothetical protein